MDRQTDRQRDRQIESQDIPSIQGNGYNANRCRCVFPAPLRYFVVLRRLVKHMVLDTYACMHVHIASALALRTSEQRAMIFVAILAEAGTCPAKCRRVTDKRFSG